MLVVRNRSTFDDFDEIFNSFNLAFGKPTGFNSIAKWRNKDGDFAELEDSYQFVLPIPGLTKEDVKVKLDKNVLDISYTIEKQEGKPYFVYSNYQKNFTLPKNADLESVKAVVENGVLAVTIKKLENVKKVREIEVN